MAWTNQFFNFTQPPSVITYTTGTSVTYTRHEQVTYHYARSLPPPPQIPYYQPTPPVWTPNPRLECFCHYCQQARMLQPCSCVQCQRLLSQNPLAFQPVHQTQIAQYVPQPQSPIQPRLPRVQIQPMGTNPPQWMRQQVHDKRSSTQPPLSLTPVQAPDLARSSNVGSRINEVRSPSTQSERQEPETIQQVQNWKENEKPKSSPRKRIDSEFITLAWISAVNEAQGYKRKRDEVVDPDKDPETDSDDEHERTKRTKFLWKVARKRLSPRMYKEVQRQVKKDTRVQVKIEKAE